MCLLNRGGHVHVRDPDRLPGDPQDHQAAVLRAPHTFAWSGTADRAASRPTAASWGTPGRGSPEPDAARLFPMGAGQKNRVV